MTTAVENLAGAFLVEILIAILLYGTMTTQAYIYWWNYPGDSGRTRGTVLIVWILETVHTAFCFDLIWEYAIVDFGKIIRIDRIVWSAGASIVFSIAVAAVVQVFFIHRIWILSKRNILMTAIPSVSLFFRVTVGVGAASLTWKLHDWPDFRASLAPLVALTCTLCLAAATDVIIACTLIYNLRRSRTGARKTDRLINLIQVYVINTGAFTMLASLTIVFTFIFVPTSLLFVGLAEIQSKLYANSLLATLNARRHLEKNGRRMTGTEHISMELTQTVSSRPTRLETPRGIEIFTAVTKVSDNILQHDRKSIATGSGSVGGVAAAGMEAHVLG